MFDKILLFLVGLLPFRTRMIRVEGKDYLLRFYIKHNGIFPGIYLHRFYRGDEGRDLHNHPWKWSISLILSGGYVEERKTCLGFVGDLFISDRDPKINILKPGQINFIRDNDFHRIILTNQRSGAWSLFISGPEHQEWGFIDHDTNSYRRHDHGNE